MPMNYIKKKLLKLSNRLKHEQKGMTGLETAIVLIAFVVIAAVFSYGILSAGVFVSSKGKESAYVALQEIKANVDLLGSVIAVGTPPTENTTGKLDAIVFNLRNTVGGVPIDVTPNSGATENQNKCVINLLSKTIYYPNVRWTYVSVGNTDGDNLLEPGEQVQITVDLEDLGYSSLGAPYADPNLGKNDYFCVQVKVIRGSNISISRQLPPEISPIMDLH